MNKVYVRWNPLHERVVCVHTNEDDDCPKCEEVEKDLRDKGFFLKGDWFDIYDGSNDINKKSNKERYNQIMDEVYEKAIKEYGFNYLPSTPPGTYFETQEIFINKCKNDQEFSEKWGLKIEEQVLTEERRYNIWFNNNYETGMERFFNPEELPDYDNSYYEPTPTREVTITYQNEKIKFYE